MKLYVLSRTEDGNSLVPDVSTNIQNLSIEMAIEYEKVLRDAGHLGRGYAHKDGVLVAYYGSCRYTWRIDEVTC